MASCNPSWQERLSSFFDGELPEQEMVAVEEHVERCAACADELGRFDDLRLAMRSEAEEPQVPAGLEERIRLMGGGDRRPRRVLRSAAAAVLVAAASLWGLWPSGMNEALASDLEGHHLKSFSRSSPCEFESSDRDDVEGWIRRELGYVVDVPELEGATLLGARRCKLLGEVTAAVLYRKGDKALTIFVPRPESSAGRQAAAYAEDGSRCTAGPHGESICVSTAGTQASMAVSELEPSVLLSALEALQAG